MTMRYRANVPVSALSQFAELANSWMLRRSPQSEEALLGALAEDMRAPSFGGVGRDAFLDALARLARLFQDGLRLTTGELGAEPVLVAVVQQEDGHWQRVGYFMVGRAGSGAIAYLDYRENEPQETPEVSAVPGAGLSDSPEPKSAESPGERLKPFDAERRLGAERRLFGLP